MSSANPMTTVMGEPYPTCLLDPMMWDHIILFNKKNSSVFFKSLGSPITFLLGLHQISAGRKKCALRNWKTLSTLTT